MRQWKFCPKDECPFCMQPDEDTLHVLTSCQHDQALNLWDEQCIVIEESLTKWDTDCTLQIALMSDLQS